MWLAGLGLGLGFRRVKFRVRVMFRIRIRVRDRVRMLGLRVRVRVVGEIRVWFLHTTLLRTRALCVSFMTNTKDDHIRRESISAKQALV